MTSNSNFKGTLLFVVDGLRNNIAYKIYTVSQKNFVFLFLSELCQIWMNFNKFW